MPTLDKDRKERLKGLLSALLLAAERPLSIALMTDLINAAADDEEWPHHVVAKQVEDLLYSLQLTHDAESGIELVPVAGGWRFRTSPHFSELVRRLWPERRIRLSKAALEALSVVAYQQPCTRLDVESVRGVDCGGIMRSLLERGLVRIVGKKDEPGRPLLYGTTNLFLETFSMDDLSTLPTLRALDDLEAEEAARRAFETDPAFAERYSAAIATQSHNSDPESGGDTAEAAEPDSGPGSDGDETEGDDRPENDTDAKLGDARNAATEEEHPEGNSNPHGSGDSDTGFDDTLSSE